MLIVRALYGLKSSGAAFRVKLSQELREMGYVASLGDPDVYMKGRSRADGSTFYEYILCYVDDILCISNQPEIFMESLVKIFTLKNGHSQPKTFLGIDIQKFEIEENGMKHKCWGLGSGAYIKRVLKEVEKRANEFGLRLPVRVVSPLRSGYSPELDLTTELQESGVSWYQSLIET